MAHNPNLAEDVLVTIIATGLAGHFNRLFADNTFTGKLVGVSGTQSRELILRLAQERAMSIVIEGFRMKERKRVEKSGDAAVASQAGSTE